MRRFLTAFLAAAMLMPLAGCAAPGGAEPGTDAPESVPPGTLPAGTSAPETSAAETDASAEDAKPVFAAFPAAARAVPDASAVLPLADNIRTAADAETLQPKKIALAGCEGAEWIVIPARAEADGSVVVVLDRAAQRAINGREIVFSIIEVMAANEASPAA